MSRYHRQEILIGEDGQERLRASHVVIVGCGALGCVGADLLARAGVGRLTVIDRDLVDLTNLQRQTLFEETDVGRSKAEAGAARLGRVNAEIDIRPEVVDLDAGNAERILGIAGADAPDVILDATDNFETRYLLNDLGVKHGTPYLYAGAIGTRAMTMAIVPGAPCLRCVFQEPPAPGSQPTCDTAGILAGATAAIASFQAVQAIRLLTGAGAERGLLEMDLWTGRARRLDLGEARDDCPCCALRRFEFLDADRRGDASTLCGRRAVQVGSSSEGRVDLAALEARLRAHGRFVLDRFMLKGTLTSERSPEGDELSLTVFHDGRAIVEGTTERHVARGVYAKYVGA